MVYDSSQLTTGESELKCLFSCLDQVNSEYEETIAAIDLCIKGCYEALFVRPLFTLEGSDVVDRVRAWSSAVCGTVSACKDKIFKEKSFFLSSLDRKIRVATEAVHAFYRLSPVPDKESSALVDFIKAAEERRSLFKENFNRRYADFLKTTGRKIFLLEKKLSSIGAKASPTL